MEYMNEVLENAPIAWLARRIDAKTLEQVIKKRKPEIVYRDNKLMYTERIYFNQVERLSDIGYIEKIDFKPQLGERSIIYGKLINQVENYLKKGLYTESEGNENLVITEKLSTFTKNFSNSEKRNLIKNRDAFSRAIFFYKEKNILKAHEKQFIFINFKYRAIDGRLKNLKNVNNATISSIETIEIFLNKQTFNNIICFYNNRKSKNKKLGKGNSVRKMVGDLAFILPKRLNFYKPLILKEAMASDFRNAVFEGISYEKIEKVVSSMQYTDKIRIGFERILDFYYTGCEKRKNDEINFKDEIYNLIFSVPKADNHIRWFFIIHLFNYILIDCLIPLTLTSIKKGKNYHGLLGKMYSEHEIKK
jgi:hypothetical protein